MSLKQNEGRSLKQTPPAQSLREAKPLYIRLLGRFEVYKGDKKIPDRSWRSHNAKGMLAYLVCHGAASREKLMVTFWPEHPPQQARSNLCSIIRCIRNALRVNGEAEPYVVYRQDGSYEFAPKRSYVVDVEEFNRHITRARQASDQKEAVKHYLAAVELYTGEFMSDFYYDWVLEAQEALKAQYLEALGELAKAYFSWENYHKAIEYCQRMLQADNCWEEAYRILIQAEIKLGRKNQAVRHCHLVHKVLERELGVKPSAETRELCESILKEIK